MFICLIAATWRQAFTQTLVVFAIVALPLGMLLVFHLARPLFDR